jgi:putative membrane protein insertion efficiency factor
MKYLLLLSISFYQLFISPLLHSLLGVSSGCRFSPTCSEYANESIESLGIYKGTIMAIKRVLSCQPYFSENPKLEYQNIVS